MTASKLMCLEAAVTIGLGAMAFAQEQTARQNRPAARAQDSAHQLTRYFADKLMLANHAEIALSRVALERASNEQVKEFAQTMIDDHSKLNDQLKTIAPDAAKQFDEGAKPEPRRQRPGKRALAQHDVLTRLCMINHEAANNHLEKSQGMLENYRGQDFDMAYLGWQIAAHNWMIAELQAIQDVGTTEFQELVRQAIQEVQRHQEKATALARRLEDDRRTARAGAR